MEGQKGRIMLSTFHDTPMVIKSRRLQGAERGVEEIQKPKVVEDYNVNMGGVNKCESSTRYIV